MTKPSEFKKHIEDHWSVGSSLHYHLFLEVACPNNPWPAPTWHPSNAYHVSTLCSYIILHLNMSKSHSSHLCRAMTCVSSFFHPRCLHHLPQSNDQLQSNDHWLQLGDYKSPLGNTIYPTQLTTISYNLHHYNPNYSQIGYLSRCFRPFWRVGGPKTRRPMLEPYKSTQIDGIGLAPRSPEWVTGLCIAGYC